MGIKAGADGTAGIVGAGGKRTEARISVNWTFILNFMGRQKSCAHGGIVLTPPVSNVSFIGWSSAIFVRVIKL